MFELDVRVTARPIRSGMFGMILGTMYPVPDRLPEPRNLSIQLIHLHYAYPTLRDEGETRAHIHRYPE